MLSVVADRLGPSPQRVGNAHVRTEPEWRQNPARGEAHHQNCIREVRLDVVSLQVPAEAAGEQQQGPIAQRAARAKFSGSEGMSGNSGRAAGRYCCGERLKRSSSCRFRCEGANIVFGAPPGDGAAIQYPPLILGRCR